MMIHRTKQAFFLGGVVALGLMLGLGAYAASQPPGPAAGTGSPLAAIQGKGAQASLTIFPVILWDTATPKEVGDVGMDIADVVGFLLEQEGMDHIETSGGDFVVPAETRFEDAAALFGSWVRKHPITTDYALYGEFVGRTGPVVVSEIRTVIVDKAGQTVWVDRQTPDDPAFQRVKPDCPLTCCVLLVERLRELLGLPETVDWDRDMGNKFARRMAEKSGLPDDAELAAMATRLTALKAASPKASLLVVPAQLDNGAADAKGAAHLASLLSDSGRFDVKVLETPLPVQVPRGRSQLKTLWDMARAFRDHVRQNPPQADYALVADYLMGGNTVGGVHFVVCDRSGDWVIADLQNSHHEDFQNIAPKTRDDCDRLVAKRLEGYCN